VGLDDLEDPSACCASIECPNVTSESARCCFQTSAIPRKRQLRGNEEAIRELPKFREQVAHAQARIDKFKREKLESINQLPELDGENLEFTWDIADVDGDTYQVIKLGNTEIWRELAFFDNVPRFNKVKHLLRTKYGTRFKILQPHGG
jgi:hypothetical protein